MNRLIRIFGLAMVVLVLVFMPLFALLAGNIIFYDANSPTVANRVTSYRLSLDPGDPASWTNKLIDPVLPENFLTNSRQDFFKVSGGVVVELTGGEKQSVTNAENAIIAAAIAASQAAAKNNATNIVEDFTEQGRITRALAEVVMDEINIIRTNLVPALNPRTLSQLKAAIKAKLAAQPDSAP